MEEREGGVWRGGGREDGEERENVREDWLGDRIGEGEGSDWAVQRNRR
jgi:hypothetical protein